MTVTVARLFNTLLESHNSVKVRFSELPSETTKTKSSVT